MAAGPLTVRPRIARPLAPAAIKPGMRCATKRSRGLTWVGVVVSILGAAVIIVALVSIASWSAPSTAPVPTTISVVSVRPGDSLESIARRVAPDSSRAAVIKAIEELNHLESSAIVAGRPLLAPVA